MKKILLLLLLITSIYAENNYDFRVAVGRADHNDFGQILSGETAPYTIDAKVAVIDVGYKFAKDTFDLPIDWYVKFGFSRFYEPGSLRNVYENVLYIKGYYNFLDRTLRFGVGEGASYTYGTIEVERLDAQGNHDNNSNYLNYLEVSFDVDMGKLFNYKPMEEFYLGVAIKHRSGIFGLINNVRHGGSNYELLYLEKNF